MTGLKSTYSTVRSELSLSDHDWFFRIFILAERPAAAPGTKKSKRLEVAANTRRIDWRCSKLPRNRWGEVLAL